MIIGIILVITGLALFILAKIDEVKKRVYDKIALGWIAGMIFMLGVCVIIEDQSIQPMDVYQGKTTLRYTVIDSVKVDSVVVRKPKNNEQYGTRN